MSKLMIKNVEIGAGRPKICVSITGKNAKELYENVGKLAGKPIDLIEWRADYLNDRAFGVNIELDNCLVSIVKAMQENEMEQPLLFTIRTKKEGGEREVTPEEYELVNEWAIAKEDIALIDLELFMKESVVDRLLKKAKEGNTAVIMSNHDFCDTPDEDTLLNRLLSMKKKGADIAKIACMPKSRKDLIKILSVTMRAEKLDIPVVTMAMSSVGVLSRMAGEIFGSAITFGCVGGASAPGQVPVEDLQTILELVHRYHA
ncbi:MAG: type I 3-dehydroquinate dehydratase [Lachnospiraceae bacterium]|nr:type I 3-dehydroquinate dehydratase [Lachnospiraceae bacterium]